MQTCRRELTEGVTYYCPTGQTNLNSSSCYEDVADLSQGQCSPEYVLDTSTGRCELIGQESITYYCDVTEPRFTLNGQSCNFRDEVGLNYRCEIDGVYNDFDKSCKYLLNEEPTPTCNSEEFIPLVSQNRCMKEERVPFGQ